jgi:hypothetical protein
MSALLTRPASRLSVAEMRKLTGSVYLNRKEAAVFMGVSEKYLATHLRDGPKRIRVGGKVLYRLSDVENYMRQMEVF